ncbi:MAG: hypothetical protein ACJ790_10960 [Myxococcaceae bacterium]
MNLSARLVGVAILVTSAFAFAQEEDVKNLYDLSSQGTTASVKSGGKGTLVLSITPKSGAHVSDEAPLKIELTGKNLKVEKAKLSREDSVAKKAEGQSYVAPRFEVPFTGEKAGSGSVDVKATFFICTDKICARQQKTLSVPVSVE